MARRLIFFCAVMALWLVAAVSVAQADTGTTSSNRRTNPPTAEDGWQAGTCNNDLDRTEVFAGQPGLLLQKAAGHPPIGFTQYTRQTQK